jgi:hypothetical protein
MRCARCRAVHLNHAGCKRQTTRDHLEESRLAAARRAQQLRAQRRDRENRNAVQIKSKQNTYAIDATLRYHHVHTGQDNVVTVRLRKTTKNSVRPV